MKIRPGLILLTPHDHTSFPCWTAMFWGTLHCGSGPLTMSPSKAHGPCSLTANAAFGLQVPGAVVYRGCTPSWSFPHLSSLWVQHPPGTLPSPFILHPDEATVQGQIVPD